jgi:hypothetical protein
VAGISTIHQEINLVGYRSVTGNICLGRELRRFGLLDWRGMHALARQLLARFNVAIDVRQPLHVCSTAAQQMVAIPARWEPVLFTAGRGVAQVMTNGNLQAFRLPAFQLIGLGHVFGVPVRALHAAGDRGAGLGGLVPQAKLAANSSRSAFQS